MAPLHEIAWAFRRSFMNVDLSNAPGFLPGFPDGCCHWACWMTGHFLKYEQGLEPTEVIGERFASDGTEAHAWLTVDKTLIDITSDEFSDSNEPVIVSEFSEWHRKWEVVQTRSIKEIGSYDVPTLRGMMSASKTYEILATNAREILTSKDLSGTG